VQKRCPPAAKDEALACLEQARDFYVSAASAHVAAARPLQLYYCFLNLAKVLALTATAATTFDGAQHGLSERLDPGRPELVGAYLQATPASPNHGRPQVFAELYKAVTGQSMPAGMTRLDMTDLLPQLLPGHRLWADAANKTERFVALHDVRFLEDRASRELWLAMYLPSDDLTRLRVTHAQMLSESRLDTLFREVACNESVAGRKLICDEQRVPHRYTARASDDMLSLVQMVKSRLWVIVGASPPYRKYYVYMAPAAEHSAVLPQLLSVYAVMFYLGSITRYRPQQFDSILKGPFGSLVEEFIAGQPTQYIYLMASEFARREVTQPSIV
jgi:hypothetical protein